MQNRLSTPEAANDLEDLPFLVRFASCMIDEAANGLPGIGQGVFRRHRLQVLDLVRLDFKIDVLLVL